VRILPARVPLVPTTAAVLADQLVDGPPVAGPICARRGTGIVLAMATPGRRIAREPRA
jgi:hypothetical protein